jgi:hypothetical protein
VPVSGHDKELFFRKWGEISGLGVYPLLCELVEGIVTVPLLHSTRTGKRTRSRSQLILQLARLSRVI